MSETTPDMLADYLAAQDRLRTERVDEMLAKLSPREHALMREVAVMAFVRGAQFGPFRREEYPGDTNVFRDALLQAAEMDDLYPNIARLDPYFCEEDEDAEGES